MYIYIYINICINWILDLNTQVTYIYCVLFPPHPPYLIMLSAFPQRFQTIFVYGNWNENRKQAFYTNDKLGPPVSESSTKISKFHGPNDSEHKFHKARIENWPPIKFKLGFPGLKIHSHNH